MRDTIYRLVLGAAVALGASVAWADEESIPLDKLPKAVTDAVRAKYPDAELKAAEKETKGDKVFYEVEFKSKGRNFELLLTPDGKVVSIEKEIEGKELPKAVTDVVAAKFPKAVVKKAEEQTKDDKTTYAVALETTDKKSAHLTLDAAGKVLATQKEIDAKELPKAITDMLAAKFAKAAVKKTQERTKDDKVTYAVALETAEKRSAHLALDAAGKVLAMQKEIDAKELPKAARTALEEKYPKSTVIKAVVTARDDKTTYFVRLTSADKKTYRLMLNAEGKIEKAVEVKENK